MHVHPDPDSSHASVLDFVSRLFDADFMRRGDCVFWRPEIVWLHVISDALIVLSYYSIPIALIYFVRKRKDLAFNWMFVMFAGFIVACGTTHLMSILAFWVPLYRLDGLLKAITGVISTLTAIALWPIVPKALAIPSPTQLRITNDELHREIASRERAEDDLRKSQVDLEERVRARTAELGDLNHRLETEVIERRRVEATLRQSEDRFRVALHGAPITVFNQDHDLRYTWIHNPSAGRTPEQILGRTDRELLAPSDADRITQLKRRVLTEGAGQRSEVSVGEGATAKHFDLRIEPLRDTTGAINGITCVAVEITERKRSEEHLAFLMAELDHRVKNNLSTVLSLAEETLQVSSSTEEFAAAFLGRIRAMARTHGALAARRWTGVSLSDLVTSILEPFMLSGPDRVTVAGPPVDLPARAAAALSMTLNELATNAAKYGALSVHSGRVSIQWTFEPSDDESVRNIRLVWKELGGPPTSPPTRVGLGMQIIQHGITYELHGSVHIEYPPDGIQCALRFPLRASAQQSVSFSIHDPTGDVQ